MADGGSPLCGRKGEKVWSNRGDVRGDILSLVYRKFEYGYTPEVKFPYRQERKGVEGKQAGGVKTLLVFGLKSVIE